MDLIKMVMNPVRLQIMQYLQTVTEATTKQLAEAIPEVPAATLYRHVNMMLKEQILMIKSERKVRGSTERLLAINQELLLQESEKDISKLAYQFLMGIYGKFAVYAKQPESDPVKDLLMLRTRVMHLTDEDYIGLLAELTQLLEKYETKAKPGEGKLRSLSMISAPEGEAEER